VIDRHDWSLISLQDLRPITTEANFSNEYALRPQNWDKIVIEIIGFS